MESKSEVQISHNQTIKANRKMVDQIKTIAQKEERTIQTITNRIISIGLKEYPKLKTSSV